MPSLENLSAPSISEQSPQRVDAPSMTSTIASAIQGISSAVGSARESSLARERFELEQQQKAVEGQAAIEALETANQFIRAKAPSRAEVEIANLESDGVALTEQEKADIRQAETDADRIRGLASRGQFATAAQLKANKDMLKLISRNPSAGSAILKIYKSASAGTQQILRRDEDAQIQNQAAIEKSRTLAQDQLLLQNNFDPRMPSDQREAALLAILEKGSQEQLELEEYNALKRRAESGQLRQDLKELASTENNVVAATVKSNVARVNSFLRGPDRRNPEAALELRTQLESEAFEKFGDRPEALSRALDAVDRMFRGVQGVTQGSVDATTVANQNNILVGEATNELMREHPEFAQLKAFVSVVGTALEGNTAFAAQSNNKILQISQNMLKSLGNRPVGNATTSPRSIVPGDSTRNGKPPTKAEVVETAASLGALWKSASADTSSFGKSAGAQMINQALNDPYILDPAKYGTEAFEMTMESLADPNGGVKEIMAGDSEIHEQVRGRVKAQLAQDARDFADQVEFSHSGLSFSQVFREPQVGDSGQVLLLPQPGVEVDEGLQRQLQNWLGQSVRIYAHVHGRSDYKAVLSEIPEAIGL